MKNFLILATFLICGCHLFTSKSEATIYSATTDQKIGTITFTDTMNGLLIDVDLHNLPTGEHGFHIHENPSCEHSIDKNGKIQHASQAGGHYDPQKTGNHLGPDGGGHKGDLPFLTASETGIIKTQFHIKNLSSKEIKNRSVMIHAGGDNYQDVPLPLGGGGARIACGIIR